MRNTKDIYISLVVLGIVALGVLQTSTLPPAPSGSQYGPAFFPNIILGIMGISALLLLCRSLRSLPQSEKKQLPTEEWWRVALRVLLFIVLFAAYIAGFLYLGFLISSVGFIAVAQVLFGRRSWVNFGLVSIAATGIAYAALTYGFMVQLP